jgi:hypothetical protein
MRSRRQTDAMHKSFVIEETTGGSRLAAHHPEDPPGGSRVDVALPTPLAKLGALLDALTRVLELLRTGRKAADTLLCIFLEVLNFSRGKLRRVDLALRGPGAVAEGKAIARSAERVVHLDACIRLHGPPRTEPDDRPQEDADERHPAEREKHDEHNRERSTTPEEPAIRHAAILLPARWSGQPSAPLRTSSCGARGATRSSLTTARVVLTADGS